MSFLVKSNKQKNDHIKNYYKSNILSEKKEDDYINNIEDISDALTIKDVYPIENIIRKSIRNIYPAA